MNLAGRHAVEGTHVVIGRRRYRGRDCVMRTCKTYTAEFTEDGRQRHVALKTRNRNEAIKKVHRLLRDREEGRRPNPKDVTLASLRDAYLELQRGRGRAPKTLVKYEQVLRDFVEVCRRRGVERASRFTETDFWAYRHSAVESGLAPKSIYTQLTIVKQLFKWAALEGRIASNPIATAQVPEPAPTPQPVLTSEQVERVIEAAEEPLRSMLVALAHTGVRVGELRELRWSAVDLERGVIHVRRGGSAGSTKTRRDRTIPIHLRLRVVLGALPRRGERVFSRPPSSRYPDGDAPINERWLLNRIKKLCEGCGFTDPAAYKTHSFRHAFCSELVRRGVPERTIQSLMGHRSSRIVDLYTHIHDEDARAAIDALTYGAPPPRRATG